MNIITFACLLTAVYADELSYNYQPTTAAVEQSEAFLSPAITASGSAVASPSLTTAPAPIYEYQKEFYSFSAAEEPFDDADASQKIASTVKKNIRVVFITTPENTALEHAALNLAKQAAEQKTAIYVLSKQADISQLAQQLQQLRSENRQKPEVHFVKYRTAEDAANAQLAIQNQYNELPGGSGILNEGTANVLNFASPSAAAAAKLKLPSSAEIGQAAAFAPTGTAAPAIAPSSEYLPANAAPMQDYLPPSLRRLRLI